MINDQINEDLREYIKIILFSSVKLGDLVMLLPEGIGNNARIKLIENSLNIMKECKKFSSLMQEIEEFMEMNKEDERLKNEKKNIG